MTAAIGFAVGFRIHGGVLDSLAAFGLCVVFGFAFEWLFILLGLASHQPVTYMVDAVRSLSQGRAAEVLIATPPGTWSPGRDGGR